MKKVLAILLIALCATTLFAQAAQEAAAAKAAIDYPTKPITMIISYGAGGTTDVNGRKFAALLEKELGQPIIVQNMAGSSGSIACQAYLNDFAPDGYTVLFHAESLGTQKVNGLSNLSYDDFRSITPVIDDPKVIVVAKDSKYQTLQDLLTDMAANPGKIKMSYTGPGGSGHVQALIMEKLGYVPALTAYKSGSDCYLAVLSGEVAFTNSNISTVKAFIESGDLRLLGVSSSTKLSCFPDAPLFEEVDPNAAQYMKNAFTPLNFLVSPQVPEEIVQVLKAASMRVFATQEWQDFVKANGAEELYKKYPDDASIKKFYAEWTSMVSWMLYDGGFCKNNPADFNIPRL